MSFGGGDICDCGTYVTEMILMVKVMVIAVVIVTVTVAVATTMTMITTMMMIKFMTLLLMTTLMIVMILFMLRVEFRWEGGSCVSECMIQVVGSNGNQSNARGRCVEAQRKNGEGGGWRGYGRGADTVCRPSAQDGTVKRVK